MTNKMPPLPSGSIDGDAIERASKAGKLDDAAVAKAIVPAKEPSKPSPPTTKAEAKATATTNTKA